MRTNACETVQISFSQGEARRVEPETARRTLIVQIDTEISTARRVKSDSRNTPQTFRRANRFRLI